MWGAWGCDKGALTPFLCFSNPSGLLPAPGAVRCPRRRGQVQRQQPPPASKARSLTRILPPSRPRPRRSFPCLGACAHIGGGAPAPRGRARSCRRHRLPSPLALLPFPPLRPLPRRQPARQPARTPSLLAPGARAGSLPRPQTPPVALLRRSPALGGCGWQPPPPPLLAACSSSALRLLPSSFSSSAAPLAAAAASTAWASPRCRRRGPSSGCLPTSPPSTTASASSPTCWTSPSRASWRPPPRYGDPRAPGASCRASS